MPSAPEIVSVTPAAATLPVGGEAVFTVVATDADVSEEVFTITVTDSAGRVSQPIKLPVSFLDPLSLQVELPKESRGEVVLDPAHPLRFTVRAKA
jgi:hypothetical protein